MTSPSGMTKSRWSLNEETHYAKALYILSERKNCKSYFLLLFPFTIKKKLSSTLDGSHFLQNSSWRKCSHQTAQDGDCNWTFPCVISPLLLHMWSFLFMNTSGTQMPVQQPTLSEGVRNLLGWDTAFKFFLLSVISSSWARRQQSFSNPSWRKRVCF